MRGIRRQTLMVGALAVACVFAVAGAFVVHLHTQAVDAAEHELNRLSAVLAEQTARTLQSADLILESAEERLNVAELEQGRELDTTYLMLNDKVRGSPQIRQMTVIGSDGTVLVSSRFFPPRNDTLADRPYFVDRRDDATPGFRVHDPIQSRIDNAWVLIVSRRLSRPDGSFAGIVTVGLDLGYLESVYKVAAAPSRSSIALFRKDGTLLARVPHIDAAMGRSFAATDNFTRFDAIKRGGMIKLPSAFDGVVRYFSARDVVGYGLTLFSSIDETEVLAGWRREAGFITVMALAAIAAIMLLVISLHRNARRLQQETALLQDAIDALGDGLVIYDADDRLVMFNRRFREIRSMNPLSTVPGTPFADILRSSVACGETPMPPEGIEAWIARRIEQRRNPTGSQLLERKGRFLRVVDRRTRDGRLVSIHSDVTEIKRAEDRLRASEDEVRRQAVILQDAVDALADGFVLYDKDDRMIMCNRKYRELHAANPLVAIPGSRFEDVFRFGIEHGEMQVAPDGIEALVQARLARHRNPAEAFEQRSGGKWLRISERRTSDGGTVGIHADITELKNVQAEAENARARMADWAEVATDWFWEFDTEERFTYLSDGFEKATGISAIGRIGAWRFDIARDYDPHKPEWRDQLNAVAARQPFRDFVFSATAPDGSIRYISTSGKPLYDEDGRYLGYRGSSRNVTARIASERAMAKQADELAAMVHDLERARVDAVNARVAADAANQAKSQFLANMSHELRTPLNAILGFAELMREAVIGPLDARYREYARDIFSSGSHLLRLIDDILDLSKIEVGRLDLREESLDLGELLVECRRLLMDRAAQGEVQLLERLPADLPMVFVDRLRLKQVLLNLLSNAVKFTHPGGSVTVDVERTEAGGIAIIVTDTGIGMDPDKVETALQPFQQLDASLARQYEGTGLGLPLAKKLTELHGGTLEIVTALGRGTSIRVILPAGRVLTRLVAAR